MNKHQTYLEQFIESLRFLSELEPKYSPDFKQINDAILFTKNDKEVREVYEKIKDTLIIPLAKDHLNKIAGVSTIAHSCHSISYSFMTTWQKFEISKNFPLMMTIGNVYYKNENIYGLTKSKLKAIIKEGNLTNENLDVHVWLTRDDMTVFDLTVVSSLRAMGKLSENKLKPEVLVWSDDITSDFRYEPILTDNDFFSKVDTGLLVDLNN